MSLEEFLLNTYAINIAKYNEEIHRLYDFGMILSGSENLGDNMGNAFVWGVLINVWYMNTAYSPLANGAAISHAAKKIKHSKSFCI